MADGITAFERLREDLLRYYDTPFKVRLDEVMDERRSLLDRETTAYRFKLILAMATMSSI